MLSAFSERQLDKFCCWSGAYVISTCVLFSNFLTISICSKVILHKMDERFAHLGSDPRFKPVPKKGQKVKIDNRFSSMFHDKKFKLKYSMDKRGRPVNNSTSDDLKRYYEMSSNSSSEDSSDNDEEHNKQINSADDVKLPKKKIGKKVQFSDDAKLMESDQSDSSDGNVRVDLARGIGNVESSSSDEELISDESGDEEEISHNWGELDREALQNDNISTRLAICNMDWDRIKAADLFVLANSFKPADGVISSVKVYPSEFGLQRMKEEDLKGPTELVQETLKSDDEDYTETKEGSKYHMEKLRKYQLNRLKYFYAILECDSQITASKIYEELDGMEYESSAAQLDLRFVPDDVTFDHDPTSVCNSLPDLATYQPVLFITTALQQASVQLTWDETDPDRVRTIEKAFSAADEEEANLKNYLASSSEDEGFSSVEEKYENLASTSQNLKSQEPEIKDPKKNQSAIQKYKSLLANLEEEERKSEEKDVTLEISWEPGLKGKAETLLKKREKMKDATAFEEFLEKKKDKKKLRKDSRTQNAETATKDFSDEADQAFSDDEVPSDLDLNDSFFKEEMKNMKKAKPKKKKHKNVQKGFEKDDGELELLTMDNEDGIDSNKHFNLKNLIDDKSKTKRKKEKKLKLNKPQTEDDFKVNIADPRFMAIYESAIFNIDPSDPHYKKTKGMQTFVEEKFKRRKRDPSEVTPPNKIAKMDDNKGEVKINPALSLLVNSIKNKTVNYSKRKL